MRLHNRKLIFIIFASALTFAVFGFAEDASAQTYYASGTLVSKDLIFPAAADSIDKFGYHASDVSASTTLQVQFSQDKVNWYSAGGTLNASTTLSQGNFLAEADAIDLSALGWTDSHFYYKIFLDTIDTSVTPLLDEVKVYYTPTTPLASDNPFYASGTVTSKNLLDGVSPVNNIYSFVYNLSAKPAGTGATVQFSQNKTDWYNAAGSLGGTDTLTTGVDNAISLAGLGWSGANFYYKIAFTSNSPTNDSTPVLDDVELQYNDTTAPTAPGTPSTTSPTADTTPIWTWDASTDSGAGLHSTAPYTIQWDTDANFGAASSATSTSASFTHSTALADNTWYARVKAKDAANNESGFSASSSVVVDTTAPTTPGTPSATSGADDNTPTWEWTASTDAGAGLHSTEPYTVEWSTDTGFGSTTGSSTVATASFTHVDSLADGTWYFRVKAKDAVDNESSFSSNGSLAIDTSVPETGSGGGTSGSAAAGTAWLQQQGFLPTPPAPEPPIIPPPSPEAPEDKPGIIERIIPPVFRPAPPPSFEPEPIPLEEPLPEETPLVFQGQWELLPEQPIREFVFAPLPRAITRLADKFPQLAKTLEQVGINTIADLQRLQTARLTLPGLTQLPSDIPTEVVFAGYKSAPGTAPIDVPAALTVTPQGEPQQRITTIAGKPLHLTVKPDAPANRVKGYLVFRSRKTSGITNDEFLISNQAPIPNDEKTKGLEIGHSDIGNSLGQLGIRSIRNFEIPMDSLLASALFARPTLAQTYNPQDIETRLVLLEFDYTGPDQNGLWTADVTAPVVEGEYEVLTLIEYEDPELGTRAIRLVTVVDPEGYVYEKSGDREIRIPGAIVSLYWLNPQTEQYELWPAKEYRQENPQVTDVTGRYSFLTPQGTYYLKVEAPGYPIYEGKAFEVKEGAGVHMNIEVKGKYWWLKVVDWKIIVLVAFGILLLLNFWRDKILRRRVLKN